MDKDQTFRRLREYFEGFDESKEFDDLYGKDTEIGIYTLANLVHLNLAIDRLLLSGLLGEDALFSDAGCGDARVMALTSGVYGIRSIGIEYDPEVARLAERHIAYLQKYLEMSEVPRILVGDFTHDSTYQQGGISFEDVTAHFNFMNNDADIAKKIAGQSPIGTLFLLYESRQHANQAKSFDGLRLEQSLCLEDWRTTHRHIDLSDPKHPKELDPIPETAYLHVYRK